MQTEIFYLFEPTSALYELAKACGEEYLVDSSVWIVKNHDRTGDEYSQSELERAHWLVFVASLFGSAPEPNELRKFRHRCIQLGFAGCWRVTKAPIGGGAEEIVKEANKAVSFLRERGFAVDDV